MHLLAQSLQTEQLHCDQVAMQHLFLLLFLTISHPIDVSTALLLILMGASSPKSLDSIYEPTDPETPPSPSGPIAHIQ
ncbi:hypothetical protein ARMGADRAFT_1084678 [Armillaria gallica]|uniref:Uncharacterized protein n=1 Tax=Armillaria gallica TaxID=47427 RepID=A0A2H3DBV3_ARMGA|nr:hypothetical protein ARMGADRAFT_1084678 [Armillaria gallica]